MADHCTRSVVILFYNTIRKPLQINKEKDSPIINFYLGSVHMVGKLYFCNDSVAAWLRVMIILLL